MEDNTIKNFIADSFASFQTVTVHSSPNTIVLETDNFIIKDDILEVELHRDDIKQFEKIVINGITFIKEK